MELVSKIVSHIYNQFGDMERYTAILVAALIAVWMIGAIANRSIANLAFSRISNILPLQFSHPGSLSKESNSHFFIYSTGRARCSGQLVSLKLSPRNDFLSRLVFSWFWKNMYPTDKTVIEILDAEIDPCVTAVVCRKFQATKITDLLGEKVKKFCKSQNGAIEGGKWANYSNSSLTGFTYICDAGGKALGPAVFGKSVSSTNIPTIVLEKVEYIYISGESKCVKIELSTVPQSETEWKELIEYVLVGILDPLAGMRVSDSVRAEVTAQRSAEAERAAREAEQAKRREELQKQQTNLSAEEREKLEEKRRKKEQRKNMKSGRIML